MYVCVVYSMSPNIYIIEEVNHMTYFELENTDTFFNGHFQIFYICRNLSSNIARSHPNCMYVLKATLFIIEEVNHMIHFELENTDTI